MCILASVVGGWLAGATAACELVHRGTTTSHYLASAQAQPRDESQIRDRMHARTRALCGALRCATLTFDSTCDRLRPAPAQPAAAGGGGTRFVYIQLYDNSDKESEYDDRNPDSPNITKKSLSTVGFRSAPESDCARPLGLRATQSFTGAVEELRLCNNFQRIDMCNRMNTVSTPKISTICPCGCLLRPASAVPLPFRTRELNTLLLHVVSPEVLTHHGYNFEPRHIALFWKKDCRTFLWKGKSKMKNVIHAESHKK